MCVCVCVKKCKLCSLSLVDGLFSVIQKPVVHKVYRGGGGGGVLFLG